MKRAAALFALGVTIGSFASPAEAYKVFVSNEKGNSVSVRRFRHDGGGENHQNRPATARYCDLE